MFRRKPSSKPATHAPRKAVEGVLLAFAMAWIAGCQGVSAGPPGQHGSLSLGSSALNFGRVAAGSSKTLTVSATNFGNAPVSLSGATMSSKYFALTSPSAAESQATSAFEEIGDKQSTARARLNLCRVVVRPGAATASSGVRKQRC
jgi:hypothetical protein